MSLPSPARLMVCAALLLGGLAAAPAAEARSGTPTKGACIAAKTAAKQSANRPSPVRTCRRAGKARRALPAPASARHRSRGR